jgi:hypothetical protein
MSGFLRRPCIVCWLPPQRCVCLYFHQDRTLGTILPFIPKIDHSRPNPFPMVTEVKE